MRIGQTSVVVFASQLLSSLLGFAATLYFARLLGAEVLGYYALALLISKWFMLSGEAGVSSAVTKRISEGNAPSAHFTAGLVTLAVLGVVATLTVFVFRDWVDAYVGADVHLLIVLLVLSGFAASLIDAKLRGERRVHLAGLLVPVRFGTRSILQIGLVFAGFGLAGMLVGYAGGTLVAGVIGAVSVSTRFRRPQVEHFRNLFDFAKFSWLGNLSGRSFNDIDVFVLGALVSPALVGVYAIAWNITQFIGTFGSSIRQSTFPELSNASVEERTEAVTDIVSDALAYSGLVAIPGFFGSVVLADRLLTLYGDEFTQGAAVLALLMLSMLVWDYMNQLVNTLNAIDRPDRSFRVNLMFIAVNLTLNVALVLTFGWVGAAIATLLATLIGLVLAFYYLSSLVNFAVPTRETGKQVAAAAVMAVVVYGIRRGIELLDLLNHNAAIVVILVSLGAATYFLVLVTISDRFRATLVANSPVRIPFLS
jgi:O-antigen/teichoic acid export membrane protein